MVFQGVDFFLFFEVFWVVGENPLRFGNVFEAVVDLASLPHQSVEEGGHQDEQRHDDKQQSNDFFFRHIQPLHIIKTSTIIIDFTAGLSQNDAHDSIDQPVPSQGPQIAVF